MIHILNQKDEIVDYFDINDGSILNPEMVRNIETLEDTFEFAVATKRSINVQERNRVIIKDNENQYREFIIMQYESNLDGYTEVSCVGSHLEDFQTAKPLKPQSLQSYTTNQAIEFMASDTGWEVADDNEWGGSRTTSWSSWKDRLSLLKQLQTTYDMRLSFYIELGTNTVNHRFVKLVKVNPIFNGEEIVYGKNMIDLKRSVDFTDVATALVAIGPENDDGERKIIEVHDDEAQEQLGLPYRYLWQVYEPESEDGDMTEARLRTLATTQLNKLKQASVEYTIQSTQLDVAIGDMIRVKNEDFTPELYVEAEIIEIKYDPYTELCDYKFGILTEYSRDEVYDRFYDLLQSLRKRLSNIKYDTENIITEILEVELDGLERYIEKSPIPPENPQEGDFWLDTSDSEVGVLYRWENGKWVKSSVTQAEEIGAITREESMYDSISNTLELLAMQHSSHMNEYYVAMDNEYFIDDDLKQSLTNSYNAVDGIFNTLNNKFNQMTVDTATMGRLMEILELITDYRKALNTFRIRLSEAHQEIERYFALLQSQYSEEKYNEILNEVAEKFGLEVSEDGKLMGDADYINSMNQLEQNLQQQIDDAKAEFDELEVGGRNLAFKTAELQEQTATSVRLRYDVNNEVLRNNIGKEITISFEAKFDSEKDFDAYIVELPSDYVVKSTRISGGNTEWKKFSFTELIKSEAEFTTNAQFTLATNDYGAIRNLKVELGNISTDWTPAPEDTDNKITNLNQEIININGRLASTITEEVFDLLKGTVTSQGTLLEQTATQLQSKAEKSYVDTVNNTVQNQGTEITQNAKDIKTKAEQSDLNKATGDISRQGTLISQNAQEIAQRAKTEDLNKLTGRVSTSESTLTQHAKEIASKVNESTYTTDKQGIIGRLSGAESSLTQQSKLIETKVGSTELTQAIDDIELGGENLIPYADLPKDRSHWSTWNTSTALNTSTSYPDYVWVNDVNGAENASLSAQSPILTEKVIEGQEYTLSFIATDLRNVYEDMRYCYMINNVSGEPNHFLRGVKRKEIGLETSFNSNGLPMYLYYVTFKSEITADVKILVGSRKIESGGARFYLKHVKLEKGNKPTGFSLSTKGLEDRIKTHDTQFEQTDKQIALRAKMTDVNKSDETLSRALSELVIDTANGLKFQWDSNGRLASYSVGKDGIQFDGSKIRFTASDSIMLQIANAQDLASDAYTKVLRGNTSGENLIKNTDFWNNAENWNRTHVISNNDATDLNSILLNQGFGRGWIRMQRASGTLTYLWTRNGSRNYFSVTKDKWYTFSVLAATNYNNPLNYVYMRRNSDNSQIKLDTASGVISHREKIGEVNGRGVYKHIYTFKSPFTASDTMMFFGLSNEVENRVGYYLSEWKLEEGEGVTAYTENFVADNNIITSINLTEEDATISGSKINLVGDVNITNGRTVISNAFINDAKVKHLYSSSENNHLQLTGNGLVMSNASGVLDINTAGVVYKDTSGKIRYRMDPTYVSSAALGTTNANVYLATDVGYEVRFVDVSQIPSDGLVDSYRYVDYRGKVGYVGGLANNPAITTHLDLGADGEVRIMNNGRTTYGVARAGAVHAHSFNWSTSGNDSNNLYIRPSSAGEVRFTAVNTTTNYSDIRAAKVYSDSVWSHRFADYWIRVDGEVILSAHGSTSNYRDIRGMFAKFDALDVNTGSHIYTRVHGASAELRVTARGTTDQYRDIRFRKWTSVSSEIYKTDITEWNYNVLDIIKNEIKIYQYKYKDDVTEGKNVMYQRGLVLERETPSEFIEGDGINQYEVTSWTLKGIQELAQENDELKNEVDNLKEEISDLNKRLKVIEDMLK